MNCQTCQAKMPSLAQRRRSVNISLHAIGLTYHAQVPFEKIDAALVENGFLRTDDVINNAGTERTFHGNVGEEMWVHITWYRMPSGNYEVTAYVN